MSYTLNSGGGSLRPSPSFSVIEDLLAEGVSREDIDLALITQGAQRNAGVPILSLRVLLGIEQPGARRQSRDWSASTSLATTKPRAKRTTGGTHITHRPVRGGSVQTGSPAEDDFHRPMSPVERKRIANVCYKTWNRAQAVASIARASEAPITEDERKLIGFTRSCRDILLRLLDEAEFRKGWCVPAYETIMQWTALSRSTVARALRKLADLDIIEWVNRFNYAKDEYLGARSEQTSNLYRFKIPAWLEKVLGIKAPVPDDHQQRGDDALEDHALMLAGLPARERRTLMPADEAVRSTLVAAAMRAEIRQHADRQSRECQNDTPPHPIYINKDMEIRKRPSRPLSQP